MKTKQIFFIGVIALQACVFLVTIHCYSEVHNRKNETSPSKIVSFETQEEGMHKMMTPPFAHYVTGIGSVSPSQNAETLFAPEEGLVKEVHVALGSFVKKGDAIFQMDASKYIQEREEKKALLERAEATESHLAKGACSYDLRIKEKELATALHHKEEAEKRCKEFRNLLEENIVSLKEIEEEEAKFKTANLIYEKITAEYEKIKEGVSPYQLQMARSEVREKNAALQRIEMKIASLTVTARNDGIVLELPFKAGDRIGTDQGVMIGDDSKRSLDVFIDSKDAYRISPKVGMRAIAVHRVNTSIRFLLSFEAIEPKLQKGEGGTKLQLHFSFDREKLPVYIGDTLDVFLEAPPPGEAALFEYQFNKLATDYEMRLIRG
ncbi:MAG: biotin/lipoyl-binding protein [Verrucomicrobia bacterium]|nr:biotin/lipoyl-binding protein [Verrucomicrobiota bacterium]